MDKEKVDLGTIALGSIVEVKFDVTNTGDQPLVFTKASYLEVVKGCCPLPTNVPGQTDKTVQILSNWQ
ncbi:MAG TPA: DUF1573 domain-containing protein [Anaerolineae bacterium]|nr:DUF1573 domain-containing protein [Anaerolineae bacterium]